MTLADIRARAETAGAGDQRELLEAAYLVVFPQPSRSDWKPGRGYSDEWHAWSRRWKEFRCKLDAEEYLSAMLMLLAPPHTHALGNRQYGGRAFRAPMLAAAGWPTGLADMHLAFESGRVPSISLNRMARERQASGNCRVCSL